MNWTIIWMDLFGTTSLWGLDIGFWVSIGAVTLIMILMNIIFWSMKPKQTTSDITEKDSETDKNRRS